MASAPTEIRTPVLGLKGLRPSPLDDGGELAGGFYHWHGGTSMGFPLLALFWVSIYSWAGGWSGAAGFCLLGGLGSLLPEFNSILIQETAWGS